MSSGEIFLFKKTSQVSQKFDFLRIRNLSRFLHVWNFCTSCLTEALLFPLCVNCCTLSDPCSVLAYSWKHSRVSKDVSSSTYLSHFLSQVSMVSCSKSLPSTLSVISTDDFSAVCLLFLHHLHLFILLLMSPEALLQLR